MKTALVGPELEENLALRYIHAALIQAGHEAAILDFHEEAQTCGLIEQIVRHRPEVVGLSMVFTARAREYISLVKGLRRAGYTGHITAGGHFACFNAERLVSDVPEISSVLHGEGEQALPRLLDNLERPWAVPGITCRGADGRITTTPMPPPVEDLDTLVFPTRSGRWHTYLGMRIANVLSGRGCFADCDFCSISAWHRRIGGRRFRQRSVGNLVAEMSELYYRHGVRLFNFHDDNFFLPAERQNVERFSQWRDRLAAAGIERIAIQVKARPDTVEPGSMGVLKEIGLFRVFLGIESNAVQGLRALGRGMDREVNHRAVRLLKDLDVHVTFNLLIFEPECSLDDVRENIGFMRTCADVPLNFCRTEVYAGTKLERRLRSSGRLQGNYLGYGYTMTDPRCELAYQLFRHVFMPRNFELNGANLTAMRLDYLFHLLRRFDCRAAENRLRREVKGWISRLNLNSADLMERICEFSDDGVGSEDDWTAFADSLSAERAEFDRRTARQSASLLARLRGAARSSCARRKRAWRPQHALAGMAILATALNTHCTEMAPHSSEYAPAPLPESPDAAPAPPTPAAASMPAEDAEVLEEALAANTLRRKLGAIARRHGMIGKTIEVTLTISKRGRITGVDFREYDARPAFREEIGRALRAFRLERAVAPGRCAAAIKLVDPRTIEPETHMFEMAPESLPAVPEVPKSGE